MAEGQSAELAAAVMSFWCGRLLATMARVARCPRGVRAPDKGGTKRGGTGGTGYEMLQMIMSYPSKTQAGHLTQKYLDVQGLTVAQSCVNHYLPRYYLNSLVSRLDLRVPITSRIRPRA